ncbi:hypothetical protein [Ornithobacterium rhinotracheale]|nr:hypothetical protein [Ornithobacterium rhinotracheale]MCK0205708.1 hypothetical protein [Ornithobacterium rhinotracheale]
MLDVNGNVRVRGEENTAGVAQGGQCTHEGTITYKKEEGNFYGCTPNGWKKLNAE